MALCCVFSAGAKTDFAKKGETPGAHWHEQYWQADGEGGWQLALQAQPDLKVAHQ